MVGDVLNGGFELTLLYKGIQVTELPLGLSQIPFSLTHLPQQKTRKGKYDRRPYFNFLHGNEVIPPKSKHHQVTCQVGGAFPD